MGRKTLSMRGLVVFITLIVLMPAAVLAATVGKISHLEGKADITGTDGKTVSAKLNDPVGMGDMLRTELKSKIEITLVDGNVVFIGAGSQLKLSHYESDTNKKSYFDLFGGRTRMIVKNLMNKSSFELHTPTSVAGVRGTIWIGAFLDGVSDFYFEEGQGYGYNKTMPEKVFTINAGQVMVVAAPDQLPVVRPFTPDEIKQQHLDTKASEMESTTEKQPSETKAVAPPDKLPVVVPVTPGEISQHHPDTVAPEIVGAIEKQPPETKGVLPGVKERKIIEIPFKAAEKGRLYIDVEPANAEVNILHSAIKFSQGVELDAGNYNLELFAVGYQTKRGQVSIMGGQDAKVRIRLDVDLHKREIGKDGPYIAYDNGIVEDTQSGLEWITGASTDTNWKEAISWVESLDIGGGGWRMPTCAELRSLYQKGVGRRNMSPLFKTDAWNVWSGETPDQSSAFLFYFGLGTEKRSNRYSNLSGAFAVRSRR